MVASMKIKASVDLLAQLKERRKTPYCYILKQRLKLYLLFRLEKAAFGSNMQREVFNMPSFMELCRGHSSTKCASFSTTLQEQK